MTYTLIVHYKGHKDIIRHGVDKLNSIIIPAEFKMKWPKAFEKGIASIEVIPDEEYNKQ